MRINELFSESQNLDEGLGSMIGKGVGSLARGAGAVAGGIAGIGAAAKKGYAAGKATVAGDPDPTAPAPAALNATEPAAGGTTPPAQGTAAGGGTAPTAAGGTAPAPASGNAGDIGSIMQTIDKLDKPTKQKLAGELEKNIASAPEPADPAAGGTTPPASGQWPAGLPKFNSVTGQKFTSPEEAEKVTNSPEFKQQMADIAAGKDPTGTTPPAPTGTTPPAPTGTTPPAGGKLTQAQQDAMKAKLQGQRQAGKTTATQTGSGFNQYVQGGGGSTLAGADAQGNPVFKQNVKREDIQFESKFLGMMI
jgi:hypothetical protein